MAADWSWSEQFDADGIYVGTATCGLPPRVTQRAMRSIHDDWARGRIQGPDFDAVTGESRQRYARLVSAPVESVAIGHQVSPLVALIAAAVPDGAEVLVPAGEFTSVTFPLAAQAHRGVRVREVPLGAIASEITANTALVALSAIQSADGALADLDAVAVAADRIGADVLVDLTQAAGWLPVDASRFAYTVCGTYKWLLSPRGTAFLTVRGDRLDSLVPAQAGWYAGAAPWDSIYGLPLRLAPDARRFDVSPAWFAWVGTQASLGFLEDIGIGALHAHAVAVEHAFAEAAGLGPGPGAIRSLATDEAAAGILAAAGVVASVRAGRLRLAFHVNNTVDEGARLGSLLRGHVHD